MQAITDPSKIRSKDSVRDDVGHVTQVASIAAGRTKSIKLSLKYRIPSHIHFWGKFTFFR
jgi:hypothetical protein